MKTRICLVVIGLGLLLLLGQSALRAETWRIFDKTCPLCSTKFKASLAVSGTQFGMRLDLRPIGPIASPWPLAVCTQCGFVLFKNDDEKYTEDELKNLRAIVAADDYKKLTKADLSHLRLALIFEALKKPPEAIAHIYLRASWQVEKDEKRNRALLVKSLAWFDKHAAGKPGEDDSWMATEVLRGELLRRLGRFEDAKMQFDRIAPMKPFAAEPFPKFIAQEQRLIAAKNSSAQEFEQDKKKKDD